MAIIVDPDNLDRNQVIFGTEVHVSSSKKQEISLRDVGTVVSSAVSKRTDGITASGSFAFTGSSAEFSTWGVAPNDILAIFTGRDAGHFVIDSVDSETTLTIASSSHPPFTGSGDTDVYSIHDPTGGSIVDGATEQAIYSFAKEEWRTDTEAFGGDDLIRHPFPFEAITREQMEIGGGTAHEDWDWNTRDDDYTIKKVRTGGWAHVNATNTTTKQYAGMITLGSLDSDAQVYFQQSGSANAPEDFTFTGPVNEAILISSSQADLRDFLKLFVRKKFRSYDQAEISDIGVSQLEPIVNRFPLAHDTDPAIAATDAEILGNNPFREQNQLSTGTDGDKTSGSLAFESLGSTFVTDGVEVGDTLHITSGNEQGYFTIANVEETSVTASADPDDSFNGFTETESSLSFEVTTTEIIRDRTDDGEITDVDGSTGTITSSLGGFSGTVAANDLLIITENSSSQGVYKVVSVDSDTQLTVNTSDQNFPGTAQNDVDYRVVEPGMYLQFKEETIELVGAGQYTFQASPPAITRSAGDWNTDGVSTGTVLEVQGSTNNDGSFTIKTVDTATEVTLVPTDNVTAEGPVTVTSGAFDAFKRSVAGETYAFRWRLFGNDTTLSNQFQFVQHQLRQPTDIDYGFGTNNPTNRGDVTDLLMNFATPTATTLDLYIDDLDATDINNVTWTDATNTTRTEDFVAAGSISFNNNLQNDASAVYAMFFTNDDAGDNLGRDYGTPNAIVVQDDTGSDISGSVGGASSVSFTFDYDNNTQRGAGSAGTDAPITLVAIGLNTAQFVLAQGTIERSKANNFSLVAAVERNYSNPS